MIKRSTIEVVGRNGVMVFALCLFFFWFLIYFSGLVDATTRAGIAGILDLPFRVLTLLAIVSGIPRLRSPSERRFWTLTAAAFASWFVADITFQPNEAQPLFVGMLEDVAFLLFYPLLLLAMEQRPGQYHWPVSTNGSRWLCAAAGVSLMLWAYVYLVGLAYFFAPEAFLAEAPSYFFYSTADTIIALVALRRAMAMPGRWRIIHGLFAGSFFVWAFTDLIDALSLTGYADVPYGTPLDALWSLPYFGVIAATIYRDRSAAGKEQVPATRSNNRSDLVASTFAYAFAIPVLHLAIFMSGWLREIEIQREITAAVGIVALVALSLAVQSREKRWRASAREPRVLVLEDEDQQTQKMEALGLLAGGIAHDFNNLLMILQSQIDVHVDQLVELPKGRDFVSQIQTVVSRGSDLSAQLLAFGRKQVTQPEVLDPSHVVAETESLLLRTLGEHIELDVHPNPESWHVAIDPGQLTQVLVNLALNARDALPEGGRLEIRLRNVVIEDGTDDPDTETANSNRYVQITVADNGRGMDEETRRRIFEPFFTTRSSVRGTGLGLAVVHGIVKQNGGYVTCHSDEDEGTVFRIHLPFAKPRTPKTLDVKEPDLVASGGTETILIAEDEQSVRTLTAEFLRQAGYEVIEAVDGAHALELASSHHGPIDLLLTDVVMPKIGGPELAFRLSDTRPQTAVLFVTGYAQDLPMHGHRPAIFRILEKPYSLVALEAVVRELLSVET